VSSSAWAGLRARRRRRAKTGRRMGYFVAVKVIPIPGNLCIL